MNAGLIVAVALGLAVVLGVAFTLRHGGRQRFARCALQVGAALLLYLCLFPPNTDEDFAAGELVLLTPGTSASQLDALAASASVVALPDAAAPRDAERAPDLATALRHHPEARQLRIVGGGLPARDRDAARGRVAEFDAAPLPRGLVELDVPAAARAGNAWRIQGRVQDVAGGRMELRDPAGALAASVALGADGRFVLATQAKGEGLALFALRAIDGDGQTVVDLPLPLVTRRGAAWNLLLLAGAPDPELKYLRRWAADAGGEVDSRIALSEGIALTEGAAALDADALQRADLVIVDERAWATLDAAQKQALHSAVREGLGLLLRVTGPIPAPVAADWAAFGFHTQANETATVVSLDHALGLAASGLRFMRQPIGVEAAMAAPLLRADDDTPLALWRGEGQGRVALWWLADSFRLALGGEQASHASLWAGTLHTLARARGAAEPTMPARARVDERAVLCGVTAGDTIEDAAGAVVPLLPEPAGAGLACAAYWPAAAGWHTLVSAGTRWPFHVAVADVAPSLVRADAARATRALLGSAQAPVDVATRARPLPRWPLFLAWLAVVALLWWLERRSVHADTAPRPAQGPA